MATRAITGTILRPDGTPWAGASVRFITTDDAYTVSPANTLPLYVVTAVTDEYGEFTVSLVADLSVNYKVTLPDRSTFEITVPSGSPTTLEALRAATSGMPVAVDSLEDLLISLYGAPPAGRAAVKAREGGTVKVNEVTDIDFDASDFNITESPTGRANVGLAYGTSAGTPAEGNHTHAQADVSGLTAALASMGMIRLNGGSFSASSGFNVDGDFTTTYRKYLLVVTVDDATSAGGLGFVLRDTTPANIATGYERAMLSMASSSSTVNGNSVTNQAEVSVMGLINGAVDGTVWIEIVSPRQADKTHGYFRSSSVSAATTTYTMTDGGWGQRATTAAAGFRIVPSAGTINGRWTLYAYPD